MEGYLDRAFLSYCIQFVDTNVDGLKLYRKLKFTFETLHIQIVEY